MADNQNEKQGDSDRQEPQNKAAPHTSGQDETAEARSDRDGGKSVGIGYGQDTGMQGDAETTAGGREGKFSLSDSEGEEGLDTDWSSSTELPRS